MRRLPHASGGVSIPRVALDGKVLSSPREWGCFRHVETCALTVAVFPTRVGVFLVFPVRELV